MTIPSRWVPLSVVLVFTIAGPAVSDLSAQSGAGKPTPVRSTLAHPETIEGVPCAADYLWRFPDGRLHRCTLDRDATVRGAALPKGSVIAFEPDGSHAFVFLPRTTVIEGLECRGSGHNFMTTFHPDGRLKLCWMPDDRVVQGIPCAGFSIWSDVLGRNPSGVYLHPNGRVAECRLSSDVTVDGQTFAKNAHIYLDAGGHPRKPERR